MLVRRSGALNWPGHAMHYAIAPQILEKCSYTTHLPIVIFNHGINANWKMYCHCGKLLTSNYSGSINALVPSNSYAVPITALCLNYATLIFWDLTSKYFLPAMANIFGQAAGIPGQRAKMTGQGAKISRTGGQIFQC